MVRIARLFYQRSGIGTNLSALCLKLGQYSILYEDGARHGPFARISLTKSLALRLTNTRHGA